MEKTYNFRYVGHEESNPRLRGSKVVCAAKVTKFDADGKILEIQETTTEEINRERLRVRGVKRQRAAKAFVPINTITLVPEKKVVPVEVAEAIMDGASDVEIKIAELEAKVKRLLGLK